MKVDLFIIEEELDLFKEEKEEEKEEDIKELVDIINSKGYINLGEIN